MAEIIVGLVIAILAYTLGYSYGCKKEREYWARLGVAPLPKRKHD